MKKVLICIIRLYKKIPGNFHDQCRFVPRCSDYAIEVIEEYGAIKGLYFTVVRILKCNPWNKNSNIYDPIPKRSVKN